MSRAALLGFLGVAACDVYAIATDPSPHFIQTWNLEVESSEISVASLLPTGVSIYSTPASTPPDSSAFLVSVNNVNFSRRVGGYCPLCQTLNGTTAPKPAFIINPDTGSTVSLPANVVSATLLGGTVTYTINNTMSFDPLRVSANLANPQGRLVVVVRSGSIVFARDTVKGENQALPANSGSFSRSLTLSTGPIASSITVDLELNSPVGDNTFINANGLLGASATVTDLRVGQVSINVPTASLNSGAPVEVPVTGLPEGLTKNAIGGGLQLNVTNPFAVSGSVDVVFTTSSGTVSETATLAAVTTPQLLNVTFDSTEIQRIVTSDPPPTLAITGAVTAAAPISVTPKQVIAIANRIVLKIRAKFGEDDQEIK